MGGSKDHFLNQVPIDYGFPFPHIQDRGIQLMSGNGCEKRSVVNNFTPRRVDQGCGWGKL